MFKLHISPQAPLLRKSGKLSMKNFGCDVSVRLSVQTLGEGMGVPRQPDGGVQNAIFSWQEIARCFWATGVFLGGKSHDHRHF